MRHGVAPAVALVVLLASGPRNSTAEDKKPIVAVFEVEARNVALAQDALTILTSYIASKLSESGEYEVVPQDKLKEALTAKKKDSFKQCYEQSCQIEIGQELAANKVVATQVMKVGSTCMVTCNVYDLKKATSGKAGTVKGTCDEDGISAAIDEVLQKLSVRPAPRALTPEPKTALRLARLRSPRPSRLLEKAGRRRRDGVRVARRRGLSGPPPPWGSRLPQE